MTHGYGESKALILRGITEALCARCGDYYADIDVGINTINLTVSRFVRDRVEGELNMVSAFTHPSEWPRDVSLKHGYDLALGLIIKLEHARGRCVA